MNFTLLNTTFNLTQEISLNTVLSFVLTFIIAVLGPYFAVKQIQKRLTWRRETFIDALHDGSKIFSDIEDATDTCYNRHSTPKTRHVVIFLGIVLIWIFLMNRNPSGGLSFIFSILAIAATSIFGADRHEKVLSNDGANDKFISDSISFFSISFVLLMLVAIILVSWANGLSGILFVASVLTLILWKNQQQFNENIEDIETVLRSKEIGKNTTIGKILKLKILIKGNNVLDGNYCGFSNQYVMLESGTEKTSILWDSIDSMTMEDSVQKN